MFFLDNASTTRCSKNAAQIILDAMTGEWFYNPSAKYLQGINASKKLTECKNRLLKLVKGQEEYNVVFTGSATEANNLVLSSSVSLHKDNIISRGEHASIYETAKALKQSGAKIIEAPLDNKGRVDEEKLKQILSPNAAFMSLIMVSNETGAISNIKEIIRQAKKVNPKILVHIDAVQAFCKVNINLKELGADYITVSSHKVHGPKGVGALIYKKSVKLNAQILGGGQEDGKRSGTENLPGVMGFIEAAEEMMEKREDNYTKILNFKNELIKNLEQLLNSTNIKYVINSYGEEFSPYILSISFPGFKGEVLLRALETEGVLVSTGSACSSRHAGNRILESMGKDATEILGNIRLSFSQECLEYDVQEVAQKIVNGIMKVKK